MDIRKFKIKDEFDLITCTFDTLNHLDKLKDWEVLFKSVSKNLKNNGFFIFDFNTLDGFKNYNSQTIFKKIGKDYLVMKTEINGNICLWLIHIFIKKKNEFFCHKKIVIKERSYLEKDIINLIKKYFLIVKMKSNKSRVFIKVKKI